MEIPHPVDRVHLLELDFGVVEGVNVPTLDCSYIFCKRE